MPKCSEEKLCLRREEIIDACSKLYETKSFQDITIKEIGESTSFTRTTVYTYFNTKEEIFLSLLMREFSLWIKDLDAISPDNVEKASEGLARSLSKRSRMLKLLSMNLVEMQDKSDMEHLVAFKTAYGNTGLALKHLLRRLEPEITGETEQRFVCALYPFIYGLYPYIASTKKQEEADAASGVPCCCVCHTIYEAALPCIRILLEDTVCHCSHPFV